MFREGDYVFSILTSKNLGAESFAPGFLNAWMQGDPRLIPERFSHGEPVRHSIVERGGVTGLLEAWRQGMPMFKRVSNPKYTMDTKWSRERKLNPRPYLGEAHVWLDAKAGDDLAIRFFEFMVEQFEPEFAWITKQGDATRKHHLRFPTYRDDGVFFGTGESFVGADFLSGIPGIYWVTYMTGAVLDAGLIEALPSEIVRGDGRQGYFITAYPKSEHVGSEVGIKAEEGIKQALGADRFFNAEQWLEAQHAKGGRVLG